MRVRLETSDGHFVLNATLMPFLVWPDVLFWGTRVFNADGSVGNPVFKDGRRVYREAFCTTVLPDMEER